MKPIPVIAIFDVGKTNKKFFLFNEQYQIVLERSARFAETKDEDGFPCDDVQAIREWVKRGIKEVMNLQQFIVKAINFSAYGASFVHIDAKGEPVTPLYNYLKPYPPELQQKFYTDHGGETGFSVLTASPVLGNLNSGMQLYWLKNAKEAFYKRIQYSLHLPQYISYLVTGKKNAEITSIGCHTGLWDFTKNTYHDWVNTEAVDQKFPEIFSSDEVTEVKLNGKMVKAGPGLHDSSSALIPYLAGFREPFILISTGTWCISFNPFNEEPLTTKELKQDCLSYLTYQGKPVKASRLFAGNEHEQEVKRLAKHFKVPVDEYKQVVFVPAYFKKIKRTADAGTAFSQKGLAGFSNYAEAYHQLMYDIMLQQKAATSLILGKAKVTRIFVDGGFAQNPVYMYMLAAAFPGREVFAASVSQASAIGAALAIHKHWNTQPLPGNLVELKNYAVTK